MNILIVLSVVFISSCEGFCLRAIGRSLMFGKITKQRHNIRSISGLASSSEFRGKSGDKNIPDASRIPSNKGTIAKSLSVGTIEQGGYFCSFEMYACQKQTQRLVGSHLANWARAEIYCLRDCGTFSMILHSICGRRVVHVIGWKIEGNLLSKNFEDMKKRGEGKQDFCTLTVFLDTATVFHFTLNHLSNFTFLLFSPLSPFSSPFPLFDI